MRIIDRESMTKCILEVSRYVFRVVPTVENTAKCLLKVKQNDVESKGNM